MTSLKSQPRVGIIYEEKLLDHQATFEHVEQPARIEFIYDKITKDHELLKKLVKIPGRPATLEELATVHHLRFIQKLLKALNTKSIGNTIYGGDMYANKHTLDCILLAAGSSLQLVEEIAKNKLDSGFAIIRPPGHHACADKYAGFCFVNNVMLSAHLLSTKYHLNVLVVDWDAHVGDGSINIMKTTLRDHHNIRYFSIHRYDNGDFYPGGKVGKSGFDLDQRIFKVGFNGPQGDDFYLNTFNGNSFQSWARDFKPDIILVSCGFDAARGDPLGQCSVTPNGYFELTEILKQICPKICLILEGGYNLNSISNSAHACLKSLTQPIEN